MDGITGILTLHAAATLAMTGLIWFVQVVHYPLFERVGAVAFTDYELSHSRLTTFVVGPFMLAETAAAVALTALMPRDALAWVGLVLLTVIWGSTFLLQVPQHRRLERGFDPVTHRRLVATNWIRTAGWSARGVVALALMARAL